MNTETRYVIQFWDRVDEVWIDGYIATEENVVRLTKNLQEFSKIRNRYRAVQITTHTKVLPS